MTSQRCHVRESENPRLHFPSFTRECGDQGNVAHQFEFDGVLGEDCNQAKVHEEVVGEARTLTLVMFRVAQKARCRTHAAQNQLALTTTQLTR